MMNILITGVAGFVGSHLADLLLEKGHTVWGIDNLVTGRLENIKHQMNNPNFSFIQCDASLTIARCNVRFNRIYHLASPASPIDYVNLPFETLHAGSKATEVCLQRALLDNAKFLLASTSEVYGDPTIHPQVESYWGNVNPIGIRSVYDEAKRYAEALTMAYQRYRNVETRIVRIFNTYGARMRPNDGRVIPTFVNQALQGNPLTVFGDGSQTRSFCYVSDLIDGIVKLMESDLRTPCNIGNPKEMSVLDLAKYINDITGNRAGICLKDLPMDDPTQRKPDISLARSTLSWEPRVDFDIGLQKTIKYFIEEIKK